MKFSRLRYKANDFLVKLHVERIIGGGHSLSDVPKIGNLRDVVKAEVHRIRKEAEDKKRKEEQE